MKREQVKITLGKGLENASNFAIPKDKENMSEDLREAGPAGRILILGFSAPLPLGAGLPITHQRNRKGHRAVLISPWAVFFFFFGNQLH